MRSMIKGEAPLAALSAFLNEVKTNRQRRLAEEKETARNNKSLPQSPTNQNQSRKSLSELYKSLQDMIYSAEDQKENIESLLDHVNMLIGNNNYTLQRDSRHSTLPDEKILLEKEKERLAHVLLDLKQQKLRCESKLERMKQGDDHTNKHPNPPSPSFEKEPYVDFGFSEEDLRNGLQQSTSPRERPLSSYRLTSDHIKKFKNSQFLPDEQKLKTMAASYAASPTQSFKLTPSSKHHQVEVSHSNHFEWNYYFGKPYTPKS